jgi:hypothetical protein
MFRTQRIGTAIEETLSELELYEFDINDWFEPQLMDGLDYEEDGEFQAPSSEEIHLHLEKQIESLSERIRSGMPKNRPISLCLESVGLHYLMVGMYEAKDWEQGKWDDFEEAVIEACRALYESRKETFENSKFLSEVRDLAFEWEF